MPATVTIGGHFKRLFDFAGRENRASFWPYAALAFVLLTGHSQPSPNRYDVEA